MILFYTGAVKSGQPQQSPSLSLGGYISNSIVPNGMIDNLFADIGITDLKNNQPQTRILALQNITGNDLSTFSIYFQPSISTPYADIQLGVVTPSYDGTCQCAYFETLQNQYCQPYYATFADYPIGSPYVFTGTFKNGDYLGLYLQRTLIPDNNPDIGGISPDCTTLYNQWLAAQSNTYTPPAIGDDISMVISW